MDQIKSAKHILLICDKGESRNESIDKLLEKASGEITSKEVSEVLDSNCETSSHDLILSGFLSQGINHDSNLLSAILKVLKPDGIAIFRHILFKNNNFISQLKLAGFINISEIVKVAVSYDDLTQLKQQLNTDEDISVIEINCSKPKFEIGSSAKLSFVLKKVEKPAVWKLDDTADEDEIDPDTLLDEDDLKKPDPSSLKVCGTTGKRKACKDCSCGLADELETEGKPKVTEDTPKSSCGSCYLGDAFRCASCPYIGMPAFKPGEKVQLAGNQLQSDI